MSDFQIKSDNVDVEHIMRQIRTRIREKRGVDYTEEEVRELANVKLEKFLDPKGVRSNLLEQFRQVRESSEMARNYAFEDTTLYDSSRGFLRWLRKLLNPILKLFFNPNPLIEALHIQSRLNESYNRSEALSYELMHNLVIELTRTGIEVKTLKMRLESMASRLDFDERRARALEGVVQYRPGAVAPLQPPTGQEPRREQGRRDGRPGGRDHRDQGRDRGPRDQRPRDQGPRDQGPRDQGQRDQGQRDQGQRDQGPRDQGQRDQGQRDQAPREQLPRDQASVEPAAVASPQGVVEPNALDNDGNERRGRRRRRRGRRRGGENRPEGQPAAAQGFTPGQESLDSGDAGDEAEATETPTSYEAAEPRSSPGDSERSDSVWNEPHTTDTREHNTAPASEPRADYGSVAPNPPGGENEFVVPTPRRSEDGDVPPKPRSSEDEPVPPKPQSGEGGPVPPKPRSEDEPVPPKPRSGEGGPVPPKPRSEDEPVPPKPRSGEGG